MIKLPVYKSSIIITISNKIKADLKKYSLNKKITVIDICVRSGIIKNAKKLNKFPKLLVIGTRPNKNLERVIKSLNQLNINLVIVGELSENQKLLLKNKINYENFVGISNKHLIKQYLRTDILVFASTYEGFGIPIIEAQKIGRPVITSNLQPLRYVAGNGALLVNPNSIKSIRSGILKI